MRVQIGSWLVALTILVGACSKLTSDSSNPITPDAYINRTIRYGISGQVTSKVCFAPTGGSNDIACTVTPIAASIVITPATGEALTIHSNGQGIFGIALSPGTYTVTAQTPSGLNANAPQPQTIAVPKIGVADVTIEFLSYE